MADLDPIARVKARHCPSKEGECTEYSEGLEWGGVPWPCPTWLDVETDAERAERETAEAAEARSARIAERVAVHRKLLSEQRSAQKRAMKLYGELDAAVAALVAELDGDVEEAARLLDLTVEDVRRQAKLETDTELHARHAHPAYEYATTEGQRKAWDRVDEPPDGEGWERNTDAGRDGWDRFDYTEESYWRRLKLAGSDDA